MEIIYRFVIDFKTVTIPHSALHLCIFICNFQIYLQLIINNFTVEHLTQVAVEESKDVEISKLQRDFECLRAELEAANLETLNERNKNILLKQQLEISMNDQDALRNMLAEMEECKNENLVLKVWVDFMSNLDQLTSYIS